MLWSSSLPLESTGDYAREAGHSSLYEKLIDHGCRVELLMAAMGKSSRVLFSLVCYHSRFQQKSGDEGSMNKDYLKQTLTYEEGRLLDQNVSLYSFFPCLVPENGGDDGLGKTIDGGSCESNL